MGAVVAIKKNDRIYVATDRIRTRMGVRWTLKMEENLKIKRLNDGVIVCVCGHVESVQNLYVHQNWFKVPKGMEFGKKFLSTKVVPKLIDILDQKELLKRNDDGLPFMDDLYMIIKGEQIFIIDNDFGVVEAEDIGIIAADLDDMYMRGYLDNHEKNDIEELIQEAFKACSADKSNCSANIVITDTVNEEMRFYGED